MSKSQRIGFWGGLAVALLFVVMPTPDGMAVAAQRAVAVTLLMAI